MEKISVFGSTGFIGSRFCEMYSPDIVKIPREQREPGTSNILNFISTTDNYAFRKDICDDAHSNIMVMLQILEKARYLFDKDFVFNQISTWSVYGAVPLPAIETAICNPTGVYSITKRAAEELLITICQLFGIKYRIFRLCNILGENDKVTETKNSIQYLINELKENRDITLYNNGAFLREYMYVNDACRGIMIGLNYGNYNEIYNLGTGIFSIYGQLIRYCHEQLNSTSQIHYENNPITQGSVQAKSMYLNVDKIKSIGFEPEYGVYDALDIVMKGKNDNL